MINDSDRQEARDSIDKLVSLRSRGEIKKSNKELNSLLEHFKDDLLKCLLVHSTGWNRNNVDISNEPRIWRRLKSEIFTHFAVEGFDLLDNYDPDVSHFPTYMCGIIKKSISSNILDTFRKMDREDMYVFRENEDESMGEKGENMVYDKEIIGLYSKEEDISKNVKDILICLDKIKEMHTKGFKVNRFKFWFKSKYILNHNNPAEKTANKFGISSSIIHRNKRKVLKYLINCMNNKGYDLSRSDFLEKTD